MDRFVTARTHRQDKPTDFHETPGLQHKTSRKPIQILPRPQGLVGAARPRTQNLSEHVNWPKTAHKEIPYGDVLVERTMLFEPGWTFDLRQQTAYSRRLQKNLAADSIMPARWTAPTFCRSFRCLRKHTLRSHISNIEQIPDNLKATYCNYKSKILYTEMLPCT